MIKTIKAKGIILLSLLFLLACAETKIVNGQNTDGVPKKAQKLFNEAYTAYQYGEFSKAEALFKEAIAKFPAYIDAHDALGKTYQEQGKYELAIASYRQVLEIQSNHIFSLYELGGIYFQLNNIDSSAFFYNRFLQSAPGSDKYTDQAKLRLANISFARQAMANPSDIRPVNIGSGINSPQEEYSPALTIDGQILYFTYRDSRLPYQQQNEDIYFSRYLDGKWTTAEALGHPINTVENEGAFSVSADGRYIFFTACNKSGGLGQCDIWLTMNEGTNWSKPMNLGKAINSRAWESQPSISSDGRYLYFVSNRAGGYGGTDIYQSTFTDTGWSAPKNLGPDINTSLDEQFPFIHSDGRTLYFSSLGHLGMGGSDLFISHLKPDGNWTKPKNLGYPINSLGNDWNLIVSRDGATSFYSSDQLSDGIGGMDIYTFQLPQEFQAQKVNYLKGIVIDAKTKQRIGANVELIPLNGDISTNTFAPDKTGEFLVALRPNSQYALHVQKEGYLFYSENFDMPETSADEPFVLTIPLKKLEIGNSIVLKNIFFDTDKYELKEESKIELQKLVTFMTKNPSLRIEIGGHTDNVGLVNHNQLLSENRAKAVMNYLISEGIDQTRLSYKGYGSSTPIATNETAEGRSQNRRTEFIIID